MHPPTSSHIMARRPLTERSAQGWNQQPGRRMGGSQKRVYGKGSTASSRAVLSEQFLDENEVDQQIVQGGRGNAVSPLSSSLSSALLSALSPEDDAKHVSPAPAGSISEKGKEFQSLLVVDSAAATYISPLLAECHKPKGVYDFPAWAEKVAKTFKVTKVAEGSYGEVFKLEKEDMPSDRSVPAPRQGQQAQGSSIFKLIPLRAKSSKSDKQTSLESLVREVRMLKHMDPVPGFARFKDLKVLRGSYPPSFGEAYYDHKARRPSDSQNPLPSTYRDKQLWALIEMDDAGKDLENLKSPSVYQIFDIFWLTCCALSYGEEQAEFEHRDLHIGNICIKPTTTTRSSTTKTPANTLPHANLAPTTTFGRSSLNVTIIDYTLSRATIASSSSSEASSPISTKSSRAAPIATTTKPSIIISTLLPPNSSIFTQSTGSNADANRTQQRQNSTYRAMLRHAQGVEARSRAEDPSRENRKRDRWQRFMPRTNALWLAALLWTLLRRFEQAAERRGGGKSSSSSSGGDDDDGEEERERLVLAGLRSLLDLLNGEEKPGSAEAVVVAAMENGLLQRRDWDAVRACLDGDADADSDSCSATKSVGEREKGGGMLSVSLPSQSDGTAIVLKHR
ncbi:hypothetical protein GJ744_002156 [Endocarpon pusillum]|uniref:Protein kinase domain-containing protein n=1 Tax=Endocarpon pusillum TaxID=364733 RepID=A0A8H7E2U1_9EURO|nr:hypothetical protein GJ744_002156 [Endocarpon pusillum]